MGIDKHLKKKILKHNVGVCISERQEGKLRPKCGKIPVQHWRILVPLSAYPFCQRRRRRRRRRGGGGGGGGGGGVDHKYVRSSFHLCSL